MTITRVLLTAMALLGACAADTAGRQCLGDDDCGGLYCVHQVCTDVCAGVAGGNACNVGFASSDGNAYCCRPDEQCCVDGFEHMSCFAGACPKVCQNSFHGTCPTDQICEHVADPGFKAGSCDWQAETRCVDACPPERTCGTECCGTGTHCQDGCCATDERPDAGVPDAP
ncbi:MAG: hypothetical protein K8W52_09420 [Deltaproteobacteria bacterium]|nr:hypothetical protein [Deltaproteobacteria bacterium]